MEHYAGIDVSLECSSKYLCGGRERQDFLRRQGGARELGAGIADILLDLRQGAAASRASPACDAASQRPVVYR